LNVVLCLDRAGLVGEDGPTHHGIFDLAYMRPIPNVTIASPLDETELRNLMYTAQLPDKGPFVIRYPRGRGSFVNWRCQFAEIHIGKGRKLKNGTDMAVISLGSIGKVAEQAILRAEKDYGKSIAWYDLRFLKPLDEEMLQEIGQHFEKIITLEDGILNGGMGSAVLEFMNDHHFYPQVYRIGVHNKFVQHGPIEELYRICGMDEDSIYKVLTTF
ncbi:MAG: transketolase C-terminal domain-containing protein, partial [Phocaeicola sp.]